MGSFFILMPHLTFHLFMLLLLTHFTSYTYSFCNHHDSSALLQFKNSFVVNTSSEPDIWSMCSTFYFRTESWKNGADCCEWDGVMCDTRSNYVIGLDLSCNNLKGELHPNCTIFKLRHLQQLNLAFNNFSWSSMHVGIGDLVNLTYLNLSSCYLTGNIPSTISQLSKLVSLDLKSYYWPVEQKLKLNIFTWKKLIHNATNLRELYLNGVDISSIRESSLLKNLSSSLVSLSLASTGLQGNMSSDILSLPNLQKLDLSSNQDLRGKFPTSNWSTPLRYLDLSFSGFSGEISYSIGQLKFLAHLSLTGCKFDGFVPSSLWKLTQLTFLKLDLSDNQITGSIGEFSTYNLSLLFLSNNNLQGDFSNSIYKLQNLAALSLSSNNLSGVVDFHQFSNFRKLFSLDLSYNNLISINVGSGADYILPNLDDLSLSSCNVNGFPKFLASLENLQGLDLSNNKIQGKVPKWFHEKLLHTWKEIRIINLSFNKLQGDLPIPPYGIQYFSLSNNNFTGDIALSLCNASSLNLLNLANNNLTGTIPQCLGTFPYLSVLDMQMNNLYGSMPKTFSEGNAFETIKLNGNQLEGPLPQSLAHCTQLEVLDLGDNIINDTFPNWLEVLQELQVLSLRSNHLHGGITCSSTKQSFPKMRIYDVSGNNFRGPVPTSCLKNFQGMINVNVNKSGLQYMGKANYYNDSVVIIMKGFSIELTRILTTFTTIDLSNNMFEGEIPQVIGKLNFLKGLNLSHNQIIGTIPQSLSNLRNLEWLDLSRNNLSGKIPMALTNLNFLSFLNLSQNHLKGIIPTGQQFNTFGNDSYEGNAMLCGFPLSKSCKNDEDRPPYSTSNDDEESGFGWKAVAIGYGCGAVLGILLGYSVFFTGKPQWLARHVESIFSIRLKRTNKKVGANRRRMN
ncbi:receptor-like protein Cf-9 [Medicago truncatula]|uniref:receptor-like protein Cf-9 n=1 Tax=Medicago truncatula TaxID=3880 RepID=UPI00196806D7|nr:receptor-like protein Cf-9 [Medicago truncatula]